MKHPRPATDDSLPPVLPLSVALLEGDITPGIVGHVLGMSPAEAKRSVDAWIAAGAIVPPSRTGERARVAQTERDAAHAMSTPRQRRRTFEELARALDGPDLGTQETLEIARYFRAGAQHRLAIVRYLNVAETFLDRRERDAALAVLDEAAGTVPAHGPEMLAVLELQAQCAIDAGDFTLAAAVLERTRRLAARCGDRFATIAALLRCADASVLEESFGAAIDFAARAVDLCGTVGERSRDCATALLAMAEALEASGRPQPAAQRLSQAAALGAERDSALSARFRFVSGYLKLRTAPAQAAADLQSAAAAATVELDTVGALRAARALAAAYVRDADLFRAASTLRAALKVARAQNYPVLVGQLSLDLAAAYYEAGRYRDAERLLTPELRTSEAPVLLRIGLALGDAGIIERWSVPDALEDAFASRIPHRIAVVVPHFATIERGGDVVAAEALYRRAIEIFADLPAPVEFWVEAAESCAHADLPAVQNALTHAVRDAAPLAALIVELASVVLERRSGKHAAGFAARGDALVENFLKCGFKTWARRARTIATTTERMNDVVALITAGYSNAQIATRMYLSKRTVEKTIGTLLKTHGVRSRWQLADLRFDPATGNEPRAQLPHD